MPRGPDPVQAPQPHLLFHTTDKLCLNAAGGKAGFPLTVSTMQLGVGVLYALYCWVAPDLRSQPRTTSSDLMQMLPVSFCAAAAHSFSVFAQSAGAAAAIPGTRPAKVGVSERRARTARKNLPADWAWPRRR